MSSVVGIVAIILQLTAPDTTEVKIISTIVIGKHCRIDRVAAGNWLRLRNKRPGRMIAHRYTDLENTVGTLGGKIKIIFPIFGRRIWRPHLTLRPRHILHM